MKLSLLVCLLSLAAVAHAQDIEVPHEFQPGTPARAEEVNENFSALADAANGNAAAIGGLLSAGAPEEIGTLSITAVPYSDQPIPIVSIQWSGILEDAGGGGLSVASFGGVTVIKPFELFSPQLLTDFAALRSLQTARIDLDLPNSVQATFILESVHILGLGASPHAGGAPLETVEFMYDRITLSITDQETNTTTTACFDIKSNADC
jgi:type VI protein secretion system component Hcp